MAELWDEIAKKAGSLAGKWTVYAAFGSFVLYLVGYLSLRGQLNTYGVSGGGLDVFDQRYLFAGCRFSCLSGSFRAQCNDHCPARGCD